jgi:hypothetical protein
MSVKTINVNVTTPSVTIPRGRGFYQLEEEELYLPLIHAAKQKAKFFSYLESENISLQFDREGRLIFIEITLPRRRWEERADLALPHKARTADIRFLDFRNSLPPARIFCDPTGQSLMLRFAHSTNGPLYYLAENLIAQLDNNNHLTAIYATDITDDLAGREIAFWRKSIYRARDSSLTLESCSLF